MKRKIVFAMYTLLVLASLTLLTACGGGGGGGSSSSSGDVIATGTALTVAEQVSVVEAQEGGGEVGPMKIGKLSLSPSDVPANSAYNNDPQEIYVHERSAESFNIINEILCAMAQSKYDEMVNQGNYKAQIDMNKCSSSKDDASSAGESSQNQSSGSTAPKYEMWTVNSSRLDDNSPHIVKVWMHEAAEHDMPAKVIYVKTTITEGKSETNPYGIFTINFKSYPVIEGVVNTSTLLFKGYLKTETDTGSDQVLLKFVCEGDEGGTFSEKVVLNRAADGSGGSGSTEMSDDWEGDTYYDIAFNTTHFLRDDGDTPMCFSREEFEETAWDYGLYDSNGARVNRNSGFSIKKGNAYGWIGYYGLWLPEDASVNDGDTVYKVSYSQSGETATPYTVVKKGGRLKKHTRNTTTLGNIKNIPLDWWNNGSNQRVKWDGSQFVVFAEMNQDNYMWENIEETPLDLSALTYGDLNFWSQSLGGQVRVTLPNCLWIEGTFSCGDPDSSTPVIYFKEDVVFPGDTVPSSLRCYDNCPQYTAEAGGVVPSAPTYPPDFDPSDGTTSYTYTFSSSANDMILKESGNSLLWASDGSGQNQWGVMSGPLFDPSDANLALLACDDWNGNGQPDEGICGWKAWSALSVYYTWETGANSWNQFTVLKDSDGNVLEFQPPMQVQYTHVESGHKYEGVTFYLEYSGFGNLHGIPGTCIDMDTGEPINCGPGTRWVPEFTIPDGSEATDGTSDYLIKALRKEQRMASVDLSECDGMSITSYDLPLIGLWEDPGIGSEPTVTNAPAVIGGVVQ
ncbi:MAG: hypothetical protein C4538_12375 [Nitrospiraceae bacterium]|nr:MAG: hypothetical protein C4538_12375 [Nitrospiraceae bacterium]